MPCYAIIDRRASIPDASALPLLSVAQLAQLRGGALLLDTRLAEQFAALHIRGSIQISLMENFAGWAAIILDPEQKLLLIAEDPNGAREDFRCLRYKSCHVRL